MTETPSEVKSAVEALEKATELVKSDFKPRVQCLACCSLIYARSDLEAIDAFLRHMKIAHQDVKVDKPGDYFYAA